MSRVFLFSCNLINHARTASDVSTLNTYICYCRARGIHTCTEHIHNALLTNENGNGIMIELRHLAICFDIQLREVIHCRGFF